MYPLAASNPNVIDVLIVCALQDEYRELIKVTSDIIAPGWVERPNNKGWLIAEASFNCVDGTTLHVLASFCSNMGREQALAVVSQLLNEHPARALAMSGICAGRRDKTTLGDVIFADRLYSYDAGKTVVENGVSKFEGDHLQYHPTAVWVQRMQSLRLTPDTSWVQSRPSLTHEYQEDWVLCQCLDNIDPRIHVDFNTHCPDWPDVLNRLWKRKWLEKPLVLTISGRERAEELRLLHPLGLPKSPDFKIHVAPIATGAAVIEDNGIFPRLSNTMRKVLGIDMEASALGVAGEFADIPVIVVKAVSDYGDPFKDDRYRTFAARAAAECLIALMKQAVDLIPNRQAKSSGSKTDSSIPLDLIRLLADTYPEFANARAIWQRAGGRVSEVENIGRPQDLWQNLWLRSTQGAAARPENILSAVLVDLPGNELIKEYLAVWQSV
jgi:nucleoside phosphorylase